MALIFLQRLSTPHQWDTIEGNRCYMQEMFLFMVKLEALAACRFLSGKLFTATFKKPLQPVGC